MSSNALVAVLLHAALPGCSPEPPAVAHLDLPPADASLSHGFARIRSIVELTNGRVIIADQRLQTLFIADLTTDSVRSIAAQGGGPGEYLNAGALFPAGGDSVLQVDRVARRWLMLVADSVVGQSTPDDTLLNASRMLIGLDRLGRFAEVIADQAMGHADSVVVVLTPRESGVEQPIARLRGDPPAGEGRSIYYLESEQAHYGVDGWLTVLRVSPYRVDRRSPEGEWILGDSLPVPLVPVTREERDWVGRTTGIASLRPNWEAETYWPRFVPPAAFQPPWLVAGNGDVVVRRQGSRLVAPGTFDVVDRAAQLRGRLTLPAHQNLLAFGRRHAYLVTTDTNGFQRVSRHPWP